MIWNKERETMPRREIEALQLEGLKWTVDRVYERVPYYRAKMDAIGLKPKHIRTLKDVQLLPYMTKQDFRDNYPFAFMPVLAQRANRPWLVIHAMIWKCGQN